MSEAQSGRLEYNPEEHRDLALLLRDPRGFTEGLQTALNEGLADPTELNELARKIRSAGGKGMEHEGAKLQQTQVERQLVTSRLKTALAGREFVSKIELGLFLRRFAEVNKLTLKRRRFNDVMRGFSGEMEIIVKIGKDSFGIKIGKMDDSLRMYRLWGTSWSEADPIT